MVSCTGESSFDTNFLRLIQFDSRSYCDFVMKDLFIENHHINVKEGQVMEGADLFAQGKIQLDCKETLMHLNKERHNAIAWRALEQQRNNAIVQKTLGNNSAVRGRQPLCLNHAQ